MIEDDTFPNPGKKNSKSMNLVLHEAYDPKITIKAT